MSRYYASIQGSRGIATRQGTPKSGIEGHIRGWNIGVKIHCCPDDINPQEDTCHIYLTGGSNNSQAEQYLGTIYLDENGKIRIDYAD